MSRGDELKRAGVYSADSATANSTVQAGKLPCMGRYTGQLHAGGAKAGAADDANAYYPPPNAWPPGASSV